MSSAACPKSVGWTRIGQGGGRMVTREPLRVVASPMKRWATSRLVAVDEHAQGATRRRRELARAAGR